MPVESVDKSVSIADRCGLSTFDKHLLFILIYRYPIF